LKVHSKKHVKDNINPGGERERKPPVKRGNRQQKSSIFQKGRRNVEVSQGEGTKGNSLSQEGGKFPDEEKG